MVLGLSALLGIYGKLFKSRRSYSVDLDDRPTMTVMIPALNEERTIPYALTSLAMQTVTPDRVVVVDDGSTDDTTNIVGELTEDLDLNIELRRHAESMGKTVGMKEVARSVDTDTLFVLDADTFLESEDYLEELLGPHAESDVASSFGTVYPIETSSKRAFYDDHVDELLSEDSITATHIRADLESDGARTGPIEYLTSNKPTVQFRNVEYHVQQRFFTDGLVRVFDSTLFPVGCAVLYDREKLVSVFDAYEESHGDDLTNSEDIFLGFAFCDRGWDNVQLDGTYMRSAVPKLRGVLKQNYLWGSGFLQSAYYFGQLSRRFRTKTLATDGGTETVGRSRNERKTEETRELADDDVTVKRPMGWAVTAQIVDGLYPTVAFLLLFLSIAGFVAIETVLLLVAWEFTLYVLLARLMRTDRIDFYRNLVPFVVLRFVALPVLSYTYLRVGTDIVTGNRDWRK